MLADWLGSHEGFFPFGRDTGDRLTFAPMAAADALRSVGLDARDYQAVLAQQSPDLAAVFGFAPQPLRPLQQVLAAWPVNEQDRLLILEAETGSGKTEAALARFLALFAAGGVDGLYFALLMTVAELFKLLINIYLWGIVIQAVLSWFNPDPRHPAARLLAQLTDPVLRPVQKRLPPVSGIDLSPMVVIVALIFISLLLQDLLGLWAGGWR